MPPFRNRPHRSGLEAFLPELQEEADALADARLLALDLIDPNPAQARQAFPALDELAASIKEVGIIEPILVRPVAGRYQVVVGERRVRAARLADLPRIPALVRELSDGEAAVLTLTENLQRADLDIEDEARGLAALLAATGLSQRTLADRLGKKHDYVSRRVRLLQQPTLFAAIRSGALTLDAALKHLGEAPPPASDPPPERAELEEVHFVASRYSNGAPPDFRLRWLDTSLAAVQRAADARIAPADVGNVQIRIRALRAALDTLEQRLPPPDRYDPDPRAQSTAPPGAR